tara:strand:+ start:490 stop:645 length:156 start_codon:yes stop_codon:yes gene_type:complete
MLKRLRKRAYSIKIDTVNNTDKSMLGQNPKYLIIHGKKRNIGRVGKTYQNV